MFETLKRLFKESVCVSLITKGNNCMINFFLMTVVTLFSAQSAMASGGGGEIADLTRSGMGIFALVLSVINNIPVMFAVLTMNPQMSHGQWLLVTLTAGVGGSLLSIGSAAGVALMGSARGIYTFGAHLKWTWAIALGYAASIAAHLMLNGKYFH